jgi:F-type H+-transporting ATPase subunit delta
MLSAVATRYARVLVDVVTSPGSGVEAAGALAQLRSIRELIAESTDLRSVLLSPAVAPSRKRAVMARLLGPANLARQVRNFVYVLIDHRRVDQIESIVEAFEVLLDERLGFVRADVSSARELTPAQRASLEAQVARLEGKKAKLRFTADPALIAGVVARVGSTVYDGSVRGQLDRLRTKLGRG